MFMHGGLGHIAGNMLFLWIFGDNVEEALGHFRYLVFYFARRRLRRDGAVAGCAPGDPVALYVPMIGASGAISAVLAAYAFLYPRSPITVLNPVFILWFFFGLFLSFPAWLVILDLLSDEPVGRIRQRVPPVASHSWLTSVGSVGGMLFLRSFMSGRIRVDDEYARWQKWASRRPSRDSYY